MEKEIKEEADYDYNQYGGPSVCAPISPNHPDLRTDNVAETLANTHHLNDKKSHVAMGGASELKPWFPSAKSRSIVWDHITWVAETQRAACNYCSADFQIKGGTSALLRHLKTVHPAAINFDPENPPPIARRKPKKKAEDYTIVNADTKSYMDNLLEQFLHDENGTRNEPQPSQMQAQSRADSEIDEVIRSLQKETAQGGEHSEQDADLRQLLGIDDEHAIHDDVLAGALPVPIGSEHTQNLQNPDEEKQVSSSSGQNGKKRKNEDLKSGEPTNALVGGLETFKHKKLSLLSGARSLTPHVIGQQPIIHYPLPPLPTVPTSSSSGSNGIPAIPAKYNSNAVQILDFEAKVLYNQSMHSTIAREDAMAAYYRMKSRKVELEIKKLERELGEPSRATSPYEQEHEE